MQATLHEAETQLSELIDAALRGEEVVIARDGVAAVRLVPADGAGPLQARGAWRDLVDVRDPDWWKPDEDLADLFGLPPLSKGDETPG